MSLKSQSVCEEANAWIRRARLGANEATEHTVGSLTMAPTLHSTLYLNSLDPRGKIHTIHASTKAPKTHLFGSSRSAKGGD